MSKRKQLLDKLKGDKTFRDKWKDLIESEFIDEIINYCECYRSPYQSDLPDHKEPHLQSEKNGGIKAWDKLSYLIRSMPYDIEEVENLDDKYDGETFVRDAGLPEPRTRFKRR